MVFCYH